MNFPVYTSYSEGASSLWGSIDFDESVSREGAYALGS